MRKAKVMIKNSSFPHVKNLKKFHLNLKYFQQKYKLKKINELRIYRMKIFYVPFYYYLFQK